MDGDPCTVEVAMEILGGKWKLAIVKVLLRGTHRFGALQRELGDVTARMLTRQLRELERDGVLRRTVYAQVPPRVEYDLTDTGATLRDIVGALEAWGRRHRASNRDARVAVDEAG